MPLPPLLSDPHFYLAGIAAVLLLGISKSGFPGSFGAMGVPLMSLAMSPVQAAAIVLPLLCVIDWWGVKVYWGQWDRATLRTILPGAMFGIALGALLFGTVSDETILVLVGTIAVVFTLNNWLRLSARRAAAAPSAGKGRFWSAVSGFTSFVAHVGGPPIMVYLLPLKLPQSRFIGTMGVLFLIINAAKLLPYAWLGQFSAVNLLASLVLIPVVPAGIYLGRWLQNRVSHVVFYRTAEISLFINGWLLIYQGALAR